MVAARSPLHYTVMLIDSKNRDAQPSDSTGFLLKAKFTLKDRMSYVEAEFEEENEMPNRKLTKQQVTEILSSRLYDEPTPSYAELSRRFQITAETNFRICTRVSWQHMPIPEPSAVDAEQSSAGDTGTSDAQKV